jgi:hypothetical protein
MGNGILLARVQKKSSLAPFSPRLQIQEKRRFPLTFSLILRDNSGEINCQIWEGLCAQYFGKIEVGDVLSLRGFRVLFFSPHVGRHRAEKKNSFLLALKFRKEILFF